jgi:hypothetical protein
MKKKNAIILNGKMYIPEITKNADNYTDDCKYCDIQNECKENKDIYCFLTVFKTVFRESKLHRHLKLVEEKGGKE